MMPANRFGQILKPSSCPPPHDTVLWDLGDVVVAPTLGSIIPHWVLAIPREAVLNCHLWAKGNADLPQKRVLDVAAAAGVDPTQLIWFEHGPRAHHDLIGCGIDHAHIHVLLQPPFTFSNFSQRAIEMCDLSWQHGRGNPYRELRGCESYLVAAQGDEYFMAQSVEAAGSQFFRRVVAALTGAPDAWNYKTHPHLANVTATLRDARRAA